MLHASSSSGSKSISLADSDSESINTSFQTYGNTNRKSVDSGAYIDNGSRIYDNESEDDGNDGLLDPDADIFSNASVERELLSKQHEKVQFPMEGVDDKDDETPWANLTYESLLFPKVVKSSRRSNKSPRILNNVFLAQELRCAPAGTDDSHSESDSEKVDLDAALPEDEGAVPMNPNEILAMEFSRDGKYLAVAGRDSCITVWQVIASPLSRLQYKNHENVHDAKNGKLRLFTGAPVFHQEPVRVFEGHTGTILSLDWSKNNFLISGSMDRTVKLWHVYRDQCLETFQHDDFVTAVKFHPNDDRFFVSGSLDNCVRLWSILESSVAYTNNLGDNVLVTALAFTPNGSHCIAGGFNGSLFALETRGLHLVHRAEVKEKRISHPFQHQGGNKITGIKVFENDATPETSSTELSRWNFLVTTNDSKIRLIDLRSKKLVTRFKGFVNESSSVVASLTEDTRFIISGSEDHWCYIWENSNTNINKNLRVVLKDFYVGNHAEKHLKLSRIFHDNKLSKKLSLQRFLENRDGDNYVTNENNSYASFHAHHSKVNVALFAPDNTKKLLEYSDDVIFDLLRRAPKFAEAGIYPNFEKDAAYSKSTGLGCGHIIVSCDTTGLIRVYRQDSAFYVRKRLLEIHKSCKRQNCPSELVSSLSPSKNNVRIDLDGISQTLMKARSMSPTHDRSISLKSKLQLIRKVSSTKPPLPAPKPAGASPPFSRLASSKTTSTQYSHDALSAHQLQQKEEGIALPSSFSRISTSPSTFPGNGGVDQRLSSDDSTKYSSNSVEKVVPKIAVDVHFNGRGRRRRSSDLSVDEMVVPLSGTNFDMSSPQLPEPDSLSATPK